MEKPAVRRDGLARALARVAAPPLPDPLVSFRNVSRSFGRGKARRAVLRDVTLDIPFGTATWIGGRNGAGKTTLLRIATGILAPDAGRVTIDGISVDDSWREFHRQVGFLSAGDRGLYARLSVRGHLEYWSALAFIPRQERKPVIEDALLKFGLTDLTKQRSERLSQGQRQRLRLALTVIHQPKVLLLDEPHNSLDAEGLEMLGGAVSELLERRGSVIWCSPPGEDQPVEFNRKLLLEEGELRPV